MYRFKFWETRDYANAIIITADSIRAARDEAAIHFGYTSYAGMREKNPQHPYGGLHMRLVSKQKVGVLYAPT